MWFAALRLAVQAKNFVSGFNGVKQVMKSFGNAATSEMSKAMVASNIAQKAFGNLTEAFFAATQQAKQFTNIASRLNLKPEEVAQLSEAAEDLGIPLMALTKGFKDIQTFGAKGVTGKLNKELKEAGDLLGLSQDEFKTLAGGGKDAMLLIAEKMRGMDDEAKKFLITQKLHGRNAQAMGQVYEQSADEINEMFEGQIASSDETIAANKKIYKSIDTIKDIWNTFLAWVIARTQWLIKIIEVLAIIINDIGELIGGLWTFLKDIFDGLGDLLEAFVALLSGDWDDAAKIVQKYTDKMAAMWAKMWDNIVAWARKRWTDLKNWLLSVTPNWMKRLFGMDTSGAKPNEVNPLPKIKQPEQTQEEKDAAQKVKDEMKKEQEKQRWEKASNEEKAKILEERRAMLAAELEAAKKKYIDDQKKKMEEMGKTWDIDPKQMEDSEEILKIKQRFLELQGEEAKNEEDIAKKKKEDEEDAKKEAEKELEKKRDKAAKEREWQDELFDAQVEMTRRTLEDDKASAVEKAQFELAVEQEKMSRAQRDYIIAQKEGDEEAMREAEKRGLSAGLAIDEKQRALKAAEKEEATKGVAGVGSSLTAVGGGGTVALAPIDIGKQQLAVQKSMNSNLVAIREAMSNRASSNVGYAPNQAVLKP